MPVGLEPCALVRRVYVVRGAVDFPDVVPAGLRLRPPGPPAHAARPALARFTAADGSATELASSLPHGRRRRRPPRRASACGRPGRLVRPAAGRLRGAAGRTTPSRVPRAEPRQFWRRWVSRSNYDGRWREMVSGRPSRSSCAPTSPPARWSPRPPRACPRRSAAGATGTTATPGCATRRSPSSRFQRLGFYDEADAFNGWLEQRCRETDPDDRSCRSSTPSTAAATSPSSSWPTSRATAARRPVRIGNGAHNQLQLDVYGELMDAVYLSNKYGADHLGAVEQPAPPRRLAGRQLAAARRGHLGSARRRRDFVYSRLMCWVAFDRAMRHAGQRGLPARHAAWRAVPRRDLRGDHAPRAGARSARPSCSTTAATSSTPATC